MLYDFAIFTPTYNRTKLLEHELEQLSQIGSQYKIYHIIVDDASTIGDYSAVIKKYNTKNYTIEYSKLKENNGKKNFWKTYNLLFKMLSKIDFKYAISMSDDVIFCNNFFNKIVTRFNNIREQNPKIVCFNLYFDAKKRWNVQNFEDGFYIADRLFFDFLKWQITPISTRRWNKHSRLSSGVHQQITLRFQRQNKYKLAFFQKTDFIKLQETKSMMHR